MGESQGLAEGFTGTIDNVGVYKRARSQSEIQGIYASVMLRCEGDFDGDSDVDGSDLAIFAAEFGRTDCDQGQECEGVFDQDGDVDGSDLWRYSALTLGGRIVHRITGVHKLGSGQTYRLI